MNFLAFDTATEQASLALQVGDDVRWAALAGGARASAGLVPAVLALLAEAGIGLKALDAIAFGRGPGAFTGLRTACAVAQGLAFGADKPVLPIDTLLAVAEDTAHTGGRVWALLDARMGEVYAAHYRRGPLGWEGIEAPALTRPDELVARWQQEPPEAVAGNALDVFPALREAAGAAGAAGAAVYARAQPSARALLRLAGPMWRRGEAVDAALALPLYLRDKVAETTAERAATRAARDLAASGACGTAAAR